MISRGVPAPAARQQEPTCTNPFPPCCWAWPARPSWPRPGMPLPSIKPDKGPMARPGLASQMAYPRRDAGRQSQGQLDTGRGQGRRADRHRPGTAAHAATGTAIRGQPDRHTLLPQRQGLDPHPAQRPSGTGGARPRRQPAERASGGTPAAGGQMGSITSRAATPATATSASCRPSPSFRPSATTTATAATATPSAATAWPPCSPTSPRKPATTTAATRCRNGGRA